ncbi:Zinc metallochaperone GTPase ZigA [Balamuthia mandrillaris]
MSEINIDAALVKKGEAALNRVEEKLVEMQNGCICCTLREDLLVEVRNLAKKGSFDYLIIESTGISEPLQVAETFTFEDEEGNSLSKFARLDTMVTVVDTHNFMKDLKSVESLKQRGQAVSEEDIRSVVDLLAEQIEFADVIIMNKMDLVTEEQAKPIEGVIRKLNPEAKLIKTTNSKVDLKDILNTHLFDFEKAALAPGWLRELRGEHVPESEEYCISSFVYRARRPFYPQRIYDVVTEDQLQGVIRSKGFFWLATRDEWSGEWASAGDIYRFEGTERWYCETPEEEWPEEEDFVGGIKKDWDPVVGDKRQEIVFIGIKMDTQQLISILDKCLLTDSEMLLGKEAWSQFPDPFDPWLMDADDLDLSADENEDEGVDEDDIEEDEDEDEEY